ncbi:hypothetical protein CAPTEDRAFT_225224 [Capitella teleta]|uniref:Laminin G domain-containing protein n=1 Tax=Capitella teleta TaxID=283909 RepID=R7TMM9_CAPTE|nr:hypothetical protein CAPTEDRAFT_225224 [Capitella teleta]|eukprot:ELT94899.1 hypothetical protein CAPTEDRAFT_225224 [Capitella teleta]
MMVDEVATDIYGQQDNDTPNTPMDIRDKRGVFTDKIPGSRVEYDPFPKNFRIRPGLPFSLEFKTVAPSGLIFVAGDLDRGNIVGAYLNNGMLTFARHCGYGRVYEMHHQRTLNDGEWHSLKYRHDRRGGRLELDGRDHFRSYHMGPCSDFSSVFFGGLSPNTVLGRLTWPFSMSGSTRHPFTGISLLQTEEDQHRFSGCLRNLRFDGRLPVLHPNYYAVSSCS